MSLSLHDALVPGWLQMLGACRNLIAKAEAHCTEHGLDPAELIGARLIEDMHPLAYQVKSCRVHSQGAIEGVRRGQFSPDWSDLEDSFAGLIALVDSAIAFLGGLDPAELDSLADNDLAFVLSETRRIDFVAREFLLGFSQPNLFFHINATYAILRSRGVKIGKRDYLGAMPVKA